MSWGQTAKEVIRKAIDVSLSSQTYIQRDKQGHVTLVDGDIDTGDIAEDVIGALLEAGYAIENIEPK